MEIPAASLAQVRMLNDGRVVEIDPRVSHVAKEIDELGRQLPAAEGTKQELKLRFSESGECFVVYQEVRRSVDGKLVTKQLVTTWDANDGPADSGLVERVRKVTHPSYDAAAEAERLDRDADKAMWDRFEQGVGENAGVVHFGLRKDKGVTDRIFVPRGI